MKKNKSFLIPTSLLLILGLASCNGVSSTSSNLSSSNESDKSDEITTSSTSNDDEDTVDASTSEENIAVEGISLNYETYDIYVGKKVTLVPTFSPTNATNKNVTWKSSDSEVASVSSKGTVTALIEGSATISVTTEDGSFTASCVFIVANNEEDGDDSGTVVSGNVLNITEGGEYDVNQDYDQIYVNAPEGEVILNLQGVTIQNDENSPIYVEDCDSIDISAKKGTTNYIIDNRDAYSEDVDGQGKGAIYVANGDLTLKGNGSLSIDANYRNGIHGKDDVKIKNLSLSIEAINQGIRGNDSVKITSGNIDILCGGDGIHTSNSGLSNKGNQKGSITISGGTININSYGDAIDAAYNAEISEEDSSTPLTMNLYTNTYSTYSGETPVKSETSLYLKMSSSIYSTAYTYAAYIDGSWYPATYKTKQSNNNFGGRPGPGGGGGGGQGGSSTYYIYELDRPASATSFTLYRFSGSNVTSFSTTTYNAKSDATTFSSYYDTIQISSISSNRISFGSWSNYSSSTKEGKGIKADNEVNYAGGTTVIKSPDDGVHANNDVSLENDETPLGNVNISGGSLTITTADDGVHADNILSITGGEINVVTSYEGLEGNLIYISGGTHYVYATDDGVNACDGNYTPAINISGGYLDVMVPTSGDTDGIDSNGTYTQTGGVVIAKGPGSASGSQGGGAWALDTDGAVKLSGGSLIVFGGIETTPSVSNMTKSSSSSTVSAGTKTISFSSSSTTYSTTLRTSTNGYIIYSVLGSATVK